MTTNGKFQPKVVKFSIKSCIIFISLDLVNFALQKLIYFLLYFLQLPGHGFAMIEIYIELELN